MNNQRGSGLIEFLAALSILTVCLLAATTYIANSAQGTRHNADKDFAIQKAISILEELKGVFESKTGNDATLLDGYDDGTLTDPVLTIQDGVTDPAHPASSNVHAEGRWKFERSISVQKFASVQSNDVRLVSVRIYGWTSNTKVVLAEVSSVIRTIADTYPPSQVYDVYALAIENVPGWWVYMANLIPFVENAISDLEARNPGLEFRTHWITTLAYGRDPQYTPYINEAVDSTQDIDWVYFYPGTMPSGSAVNTYYVPTGINAQISVDGTVQNDYDATDNPHPYALADMYNHAMRYEDEKALFEARVAAGLENADEPTWRLLIEDMHLNPEKYTNAIFINVHGELFPFPPIRNFSDAAKQPDTRPGVRVVTHPEQLRYNNSDDMQLRVYSYLWDPDATGAPERLDTPISVVIKGLSGSSSVWVRAIEGGFDTDGDTIIEDYFYDDYDTADDGANDMWYSKTDLTGGDVLIELYNSPLKHGLAPNNSGLHSSGRLYGMEYIPSPIATSFSYDLTLDRHDVNSDGTLDYHKNTARWVITVAESDMPDDALVTVETRIGTDLTTGVLHPTANEPTNVSRTYAYVGTDTWIFGDGTTTNPPHLPYTERYQVMGDPRHMPYVDLTVDYDATANKLGQGYNRYFDDLGQSARYWWYDTDTGWGDDTVEVDINRSFQFLRTALFRSHAIYTTMTGFSYYYMGVGNEIGYDASNGFSNSIPVSTKPYNGSTGSMYENTITGSVKYVRSNESGNTWWATHWLGELYPDAEYSAGWSVEGNLPTGSGSGTYVRDERQDINERDANTDLGRSRRRLTEEGSTNFFSIGTSGSKFHHQFRDGSSGDLVDEGLGMETSYNFPIPTRVRISRPFNVALNGAGSVPEDYQDAMYIPEGTPSGTVIATYFDHDNTSVLGSALIKHEGGGDDHSFVVVNGIDRTIYTGSAFMGRWAFLSLLQSFFEAGLETGAKRVAQVPRIEVTQPNDTTDLTNPTSINIAWQQEWLRWDGEKYASGYSSTFSESATISYAVLYSDDNGKTWKHASDGSAATAGERPASSYLTLSTSATLNTPSGTFPKGTYLIRVEAYSDARALHYSYHQRRIFIKR